VVNHSTDQVFFLKQESVDAPEKLRRDLPDRMRRSSHHRQRTATPWKKGSRQDRTQLRVYIKIRKIN
jgi:hypothetical protein